MIKDRIGILIGNSDGDKKEQSGFIFIWIVILTHGLDLGSGVPQISQKCLRYSQRASIKDGIGILIRNSTELQRKSSRVLYMDDYTHDLGAGVPQI